MRSQNWLKRQEQSGMSRNKPLKLVIDTNLWISFIISNKLNQLEPFLYTHEARILFSSELIQELESTIAKPKLQKFFLGNSLDEMLNVFDPFIDFIKIESKVKMCRDPKDDFLLALAKDGKANYLLTGDKDLLEIGKFDLTIILKVAEFLKKEKY